MKVKIDNIEKLESKIGYKFRNIKLLENALTHSSYSNENKTYKRVNNERLEFLGDSVLSIVVSRHIFKEFPNYPEGDLSKLRAQVVCEDMLNEIALKLGIGQYLVLGKGEEATGGRIRKSILADAMEAIIASIYLDGSLEDADKFILSNLEESIDTLVKGKIFSDYKSYLQEYFQGKNSNYRIKYVVTGEEGPDHDKVFYVDVLVNKKKFGSGVGKSKKTAEQNAAKKSLLRLGEIYE
ncbi:ribonuclease III [Sedimentibacter sp. zth1]|uniref:ribonuclease III n=1 Tax=Sedimentibacter sp. zth1 TaxID=2816908 RepID=UPI001A928CF5|nr:ribonuclease III [Sedimentibacter sp. zth1]QSX06595.1 ribonuclease III [Sedimentibacter sp. zth1]